MCPCYGSYRWINKWTTLRKDSCSKETHPNLVQPWPRKMWNQYNWAPSNELIPKPEIVSGAVGKVHGVTRSLPSKWDLLLLFLRRMLANSTQGWPKQIHTPAWAISTQWLVHKPTSPPYFLWIPARPGLYIAVLVSLLTFLCSYMSASWEHS